MQWKETRNGRKLNFVPFCLFELQQLLSFTLSLSRSHFFPRQFNSPEVKQTRKHSFISPFMYFQNEGKKVGN